MNSTGSLRKHTLACTGFVWLTYVNNGLCRNWISNNFRLYSRLLSAFVTTDVWLLSFFRFLVFCLCFYVCVCDACYWFFRYLSLCLVCWVELAVGVFCSVAGNNGAITYRRYCYNRRHDQILMNVDLVVIVAAVVNAIVSSLKSPFNIFSHLIMSQMLSFAWFDHACGYFLSSFCVQRTNKRKTKRHLIRKA